MPLSEDQEAAVLDDLCDGWGVENIALRHGLPLAEVRALVDDLRRSGLLAELFFAGRWE